jgi:hypothetical protein
VADSASGWEGLVYDNIEVVMPYPTGYSPWISLYGLSGSPDADMEYIYNMRTDDLSLTYYLELTDNLTFDTWTNMGYTVEGTNITGGLFDQVTNSVPTTETKKFIRLTVEN